MRKRKLSMPKRSNKLSKDVNLMKKNLFVYIYLKGVSNGLKLINNWKMDCFYDNNLDKKARRHIIDEISNSIKSMDSKMRPLGLNMGNPIIENHQECIEENEEIEIVREVQGVVIRSNDLTCSDFITGLDFKNPMVINKEVEFPMDNKEEIIIEFKDKCAGCGEYLGESYNVVYKYKSVCLSLNTDYGGRIHSFRTMDIKEIDEAGLDASRQYIYLELSDYDNPHPFSNKIIKVYIQKSSWDEINKGFMKANGRPIEVGDHLYDLVIDKQNRAIKYSYGVPKLSRDEDEEN